MVGFVLGPFIFAACMFGMVTQVSLARHTHFESAGLCITTLPSLAS
jgi:hypothetical protein